MSQFLTLNDAPGDECVVALTDQWYITYGEDEWAASTRKCLEQLNTYGAEARASFEHTLGRLLGFNIEGVVLGSLMTDR